MALVEQHKDTIPTSAACAAVGLSRATLYRARRPAPKAASRRSRSPSPRRLSDEERQHLLDTLHLTEFADQPPTEVYPTLLGRGVYLASIRTMYRVLAEAGESKERRNQRPPREYVTPSLTATAPNQAWTWDITKLATLAKGVFLHAYVIIDLFSRYVVGWMLATKDPSAFRTGRRASRCRPRKSTSTPSRPRRRSSLTRRSAATRPRPPCGARRPSAATRRGERRCRSGQLGPRAGRVQAAEGARAPRGEAP